MATMASLVNLGSSVASSSTGNFEVSFSLVKRVSYPRRVCTCNLRPSGGGKKWRYVSVCRFSVITDFVPDQGNAVSLEKAFKESKDEGNDLQLMRPSPKPVMTADSGGGEPQSGGIEGGGSSNGMFGSEVEKNQVIDSLDEVLEKAEKLETNNTPVDSVNNRRPVLNRPAPAATPASSSYSSPVSSSEPGKSLLGNNVWRKGDSVSKVQKADKKTPEVGKVGRAESRVDRDARSVWKKGDSASTVQKLDQKRPELGKVERVETRTEGEGKMDAQVNSPFRSPIPPQRPQIQLQGRPSLAPPPRPRTDQAVEAKERKGPILVDKFAQKKAFADPAVSEAVPSPQKPSNATPGPSGKFRDTNRRKSAPYGGPPKRRVMKFKSQAGQDSPALGAGKGRRSTKARRRAARRQAALDAAPVKVEILEVGEEGMSTEELAYNLAVSEGEIMGRLFLKGIRTDGAQTLDKDMVKMVCQDYDVEVLDAIPVKVEDMAKKKETLDLEDLDNLEDRPPVITIMGHVDHGKTTLLDYIRKTKVAASEAGGITQGIGAYKVQVLVDGESRPCVFLDTPGHEAFGAMRARGARVTDIAVIVVAADDGIRPQTNEAIAHAKAAGVPIVIAINKIDKDGASSDRVMQELATIGMVSEEYGGDVPMVPISALKGQGIDDLLETVMLVAELQELNANPHRSAKGTIIEAGLDKLKGPVATFIVQNGTLRRGDMVVCGEAFGKVRTLLDDGGKTIDEAGPSMPVQVIGLHSVPIAGDEFEVVSSLEVAREKAHAHAESLKQERIAAKAGDGKVTLSSFASAVSTGVEGLDLHQLNIVLKVDVQGSVEAVKQALQVLPQDNVTLKFLLQSAGEITISDVDLALASKAIIFGFNVKAPVPVEKYAESKGVEIRIYKVIYDLIDDVRSAMEGLLDLVEEQVPVGTAEVRAVFSAGSGRVAGCIVTEGKLVKGCGLQVVRRKKTVHVGILDSLRRVKESVDEVTAGLECGIGMDDFDKFAEGDILEAFTKVKKKRTLEEASAQVSAALKGAGVDR